MVLPSGGVPMKTGDIVRCKRGISPLVPGKLYRVINFDSSTTYELCGVEALDLTYKSEALAWYANRFENLSGE